MGRDEVEIEKFRKKLEKDGFFEDVILDQASVVLNETDGGISGWMYYLKKYKKIEVKKFKDLFCQLKEVIFPIIITKMYGRTKYVRFEFKDRVGKKYYFICDSFAYNFENMSKYIIGRINSSIEPLTNREFYYQILTDCNEFDNSQALTKENIELYKTLVSRLNIDGTHTDLKLEFNYNCYEEKTTKVIMNLGNKKIIMEYPSKEAEFDKKVEDILFNIDEGSNKNKWIYYNVKPLLKEMLEIIDKEDVSIYIGAELDNDVYAEVTVTHNVVQRYTYTEVVREDRMVRTTNIFSKKLDEFLN